MTPARPTVIKRCLVAGLGLLMTACAPTKVLNFTSGADALRVEKDVAYGDHPRQKLDIYRGKAARCRILFVYGGSWQEGDKADYGFVGAQLAKRGYEVVIANYRLYPEVRYPAFVEDIAQSIKYLESEHPSEAPWVLMGHSAGAMIASMVSYQPSYLQAVGLNPDLIRANIAISGPHDYFLPSEKPRWQAIFGELPRQQVDALTVNHVSAQAPPSLILHGTADEIVTPKSAVSVTEKLEALGVPVSLKLYEGVGHRRIIAALASPLHFLAPTLDDIQQFLDNGLCRKEN